MINKQAIQDEFWTLRFIYFAKQENDEGTDTGYIKACGYFAHDRLDKKKGADVRGTMT